MASITGVLPKRHGFLKGTHRTASEPRTCSDRNPAQHSSRRASHHLPRRALQRGLRGQGEKQGGQRGDTRKPPLPPNHPPPRGRLQLVSRQSGPGRRCWPKANRFPLHMDFSFFGQPRLWPGPQPHQATPSHTCDLRHTLRQCRMRHLLSQARH